MWSGFGSLYLVQKTCEYVSLCVIYQTDSDTVVTFFIGSQECNLNKLLNVRISDVRALGNIRDLVTLFMRHLRTII